MNRIETKAFAKVNLFLNVVGKRPDGYHELEMFNATIDLCDDVRIERMAGLKGVRVHSNDKFLENGENLITRVATELLAMHSVNEGITIEIEKRIPAGAGLGGNSADAAAVVRALNDLFGWRMTNADRAAFVLRHGADIPYCLDGGPAAVRGVGERIEPYAVDLSGWSVLVVHPNVFTSTEDVFAAWDAGVYPSISFNGFLAAARKNDVAGMIRNMNNALEPATFSIVPEVGEWKRRMMQELGPEGIAMTGSGSTILKVFVVKTPEIDRFIAQNGVKCRIFIGKFTK